MKFVRHAACSVALFCLVACAKKAAPVDSLGASSASATSANTTASTGELDLAQTCTQICERSHVLKCSHASQCLTNCVAAASGTPCNPEFTAFYGCIVKEPIKNWECAEDGVASIREGLCDAEQERAVACMQAKASR